MDLEHGNVRRAADQAHEVIVMGFDPPGAAIAARGLGRNLPRRLELLHPAHRARDADLEKPGRRVARQPVLNDSPHHPFAKIVRKRHPRRLLLAAGIINQISADSRIQNQFSALGSALNLPIDPFWFLSVIYSHRGSFEGLNASII